VKISPEQNGALHLYFRLLAEAMNDAGYDLQHVIEQKTVSVPWTERMVKEILFRELMKVMTGKESTTQLTSHEITRIYEVMNRHIAEVCGLSVPFPSEDEL